MRNFTDSTRSKGGKPHPPFFLTTTTTQVVTMTIPLGSTTTGVISWTTAPVISVQLMLPSGFPFTNNIGSAASHGPDKAAVVGIVFSVICLVIILLAGGILFFRRRSKRARARNLPQTGQVSGSYHNGANYFVSSSRSRQGDLESLDDISEETVTVANQGSPHEPRVPRLYTNGSVSSFTTISSIPIPFYQRLKEARRAGTKFTK